MPSDSPTPLDEQMMRRAMRLAMNGRGRVEPNPTVGCVITRGGRVLAEGYHRYFGGPHAEAEALAACAEPPRGATAYVTLEPCCHTNKKTPPCAPQLVDAGIARVVVGCLDPNPQVNGGGTALLRAAGVAVTAPVLENEAKQLIAPFIAGVSLDRPYVTLKWAQSANGLVAGAMGRRIRITNDTSNHLVHLLRSRCDAIAVGTNTVLNDDPLLTARLPEKNTRQPLRIVLSNTLKLPLESRLARSAREHPVILYCSNAALASNGQAARALRSAGVEIVPLPDHENRFSFADVLSNLHARNVTHLLVEPGPTLSRYFLARGQADRVWVFTSPRPVDEEGALAISRAPALNYPSTGEVSLDGDRLTEYLNPDSAAFFARQASPDLVLAGDD